VVVVATNWDGCKIVIELTTEQPLLSVTVTLCTPAHKLSAVGVCWKLGVQLNVYGAVPPKVFTVAEPSHALKQLTSTLVNVAITGCGWVITTLNCAVQLFASVTVIA
jgi:hypothetical protein